ncbi:hypothetical protein [Rudaeicoccus suwonensis]|uniref:Cell division protein FtsL n=1 Tax=Rudaeicoccus suwonensis TaxID=657409 RepID=A0A561ECB0_9MICO|nr:hypothetical protein [Rudaeicoccus suwonensis]TWE13246.1 hypothetical protein BKA23_2075 [Rudaeicoccus suwonensis]
MSQMTASARTARPVRLPARPAPVAATRPRLHAVPTAEAPEHRGVGFVLLCVVLLAGGLISLLVLNTDRAQQSFVIANLQARSASLADVQQELSSNVDLLGSPENLARRATAMGLGPAKQVRYVDRATGKVLGVANNAGTGSPFTVDTLPSTPASQTANGAVFAGGLGVLVTPNPPKAAAKTTTKTPAKSSPSPTTTPGSTAKTSPKHSAKPTPKTTSTR